MGAQQRASANINVAQSGSISVMDDAEVSAMAQVVSLSVGRTRSGLDRPPGQKLHTKVSSEGQQYATSMSYNPHALDPDSNRLAPSAKPEHVAVLPSYGT